MEHLMEVDDFELTPATYEVMLVVGLGEDTELDHQPLREFETPEEAIEFAKAKTVEYRNLLETGTYNWDGNRDIQFACITVETKVRYEDDEDYVGQLYNEPVYVKERDK